MLIMGKTLVDGRSPLALTRCALWEYRLAIGVFLRPMSCGQERSMESPYDDRAAYVHRIHPVSYATLWWSVWSG